MNKEIIIEVTQEQEKQLQRQAEQRRMSLTDYLLVLAQKDRLKIRKKRDRYRINYGRGVEKAHLATAEKAMRKADIFAARTGRNISIEKGGSVVAFRQWRKGNEGLEEQKSPIVFGNRGYFADWVVLDQHDYGHAVEGKKA